MTKYQRIVSELLSALKGTRSPVELSKSMGYNFNQVKRWESGEKQLRWDEFCNYCNALDVPLSNVLANIFQYDRPDPLKFLNHLYSNKFPLYSIEALSEKLHRHPSAIRRYIDGEIFPDLEFVLAFVDLCANQLAILILTLLPVGAESPLRSLFEAEFKKLSSEAEAPLAAAIEGWLVTETYRKLEQHDDEFLAQRVGCSAEEVKRILSDMMKVGTVIRHEDGKLTVDYHTILMTGLDPVLLNKFFKFWYQRAALHYEKEPLIHRGTVRGVGSCRLMAVSQKTSQEINEIIIRADAEIRAVLTKYGDSVDSGAEADTRDDVRVILMKTFSTQDF